MTTAAARVRKLSRVEIDQAVRWMERISRRFPIARRAEARAAVSRSFWELSRKRVERPEYKRAVAEFALAAGWRPRRPRKP